MPNGERIMHEESHITRWDVLYAYDFIRKLDGFGVSLPVMMFSDDGKVGFYWDNDDHYVDVDVEPIGVSVYLRDRITKDERFIEKIETSELTEEWATRNLSPFKRTQ